MLVGDAMRLGSRVTPEFKPHPAGTSDMLNFKSVCITAGVPPPGVLHGCLAPRVPRRGCLRAVTGNNQ